jgi:hypothetical protein
MYSDVEASQRRMALHKKPKIPYTASVGIVQVRNYSFECRLLCCSVALVFEDVCSSRIQINSVDLNDSRTAVRGICSVH